MKTTEDRLDSSPEDEPTIYAVRKGKEGWTFNRRDFLIAAGATMAITIAGCYTPSPEEACKNVKAHESDVWALAITPDGSTLA